MPTPTPAPSDKKVGRPSDYNGPGYYKYGHRWDEEISDKPREVLTWRYFDGEDWIGPEVGEGMVDVYKALVRIGPTPTPFESSR